MEGWREWRGLRRWKRAWSSGFGSRKGYYMGVYGDSCGGDDRVKIFCGKSQGFRCRID